MTSNEVDAELMLRKRLRPVARLLRSLYSRRRHWLLEFDLARAIPGITPPAGVVFRPAARADVERFPRDPQHEVPRHAARLHRGLFDAGCPFFVGDQDGRIIYRAWAVLRTWRIAGPHHLKLGRGKATVLGCFTVQDQRGRGVYPAALTAQLWTLKQAGVRRAFINVEDTNIASLRGIEKAGFRRMGQYSVTRLAGRVTLIMDPALRREVEEDPLTL